MRKTRNEKLVRAALAQIRTLETIQNGLAPFDGDYTNKEERTDWYLCDEPRDYEMLMIFFTGSFEAGEEKITHPTWVAVTEDQDAMPKTIKWAGKREEERLVRKAMKYDETSFTVRTFDACQEAWSNLYNTLAEEAYLRGRKVADVMGASKIRTA